MVVLADALRSACPPHTSTMVTNSTAISWSSEATSTRRPARLSLNIKVGGCSRGASEAIRALEGEELVAKGGVLAQAGGRAAEPDRAFFQHIDAVGQRQRELRVLLGQQDRQPLPLEPGDLLAQVVHHQGRQTFRGLVEQQE